eukprot:3559057-Pyramimonas_sp.AAC.1
MASSECWECASGSIGSALIPESTPLRSVEPKAGSTEASTASLRCVTLSRVPSPLGRAIAASPRACRVLRS